MTLHDVYYHSKPYLLIFGGGWAMLAAPNGPAVVAGLVLVGLGGWIWKMRNSS